MNNNIVWHKEHLTRSDRERLNGHKPTVIWFTGLPSSGKSTIAHALDEVLFKKNIHSYVLDGDNIRYGLNKDLGMSPNDRKENIRRVGEVAKLFLNAGFIVIAAFISPYRNDRDSVRRLFRKNEFIEIYVKCPLEVCEKRDPKGHYAKARTGLIREFTGIAAPYEKPLYPALVLDTDRLSVKECVDRVIDYLVAKHIIRRSNDR